MSSAAADHSPPEHLDTQKKTFCKWLNSQLANEGTGLVITDLFCDLRDGLILIAVLEILTKEKVKKERGSLRVHKLSNVAIVLNVLRENQVKLVDVNNVDIVDGNPKITLALVWAIILHWQFNRVLGSEIQHVSNLEKSLLAWCRQSTVNYSQHVNIVDFTTSWKDGKAFLAVLHNFSPTSFDFDAIVRQKSDPLKLLEYAFSMISQTLKISRLLDPEDLVISKPDKKSVMTYVMCLFQALPHDYIDMDILDDVSIQSDPGFVPKNIIGSPFKSPLMKGKPLSYQTFTSVHEDVLVWLLDVEDKLKLMPPVAEDLFDVREQFQNNRSFLHDVESQDGAIGHVRKEGTRLIQSGLPIKEEKDVKVRLKLLLDRWNDFRSAALSKQNEISKKLMELQQKELYKIREWMTTAEDKISRMGNIGFSIQEVEKQIYEHKELQKQFAEREALISKFINVVPAVDTTKENDSSVSDCEQDFEGHLMAIEERWFVLCSWIESRGEKLQQIWKSGMEFNSLKTEMVLWLDDVGQSLRLMEKSPTEEVQVLEVQATEIKKIEGEIENRSKTLEKIEAKADGLLQFFDSDAQACTEISRSLETVQDRWEVLSNQMDAQRQRLSSLGLNLRTSISNARRSASRSPNRREKAEEAKEKSSTPSKKKKTSTSSKRIEFESSYSNSQQWLSKIGEKLLSEVSNDEDVLEATLTDLETNLDTGPLSTIRLGEELIAEIKGEQDFPPDYLMNVTDKMNSLRSQVDSLEKDRVKAKQGIDYRRQKNAFYVEYEKLKEQMSLVEKCLNEDILFDLSSQTHLEVIDQSLLRCRELRKDCERCEETIQKMKSISGQVTQLPGAFDDPSNKIKFDFYEACEKWRSIETIFAQREVELERFKKEIEERRDGNQTDVTIFSSYEGNRSGSCTNHDDRELVHKLQMPIVIESQGKVEEEIAWLRCQLEEGTTRDVIKRKVKERISNIETEVGKLKHLESELEGLNLFMTRGEETLNKGSEAVEFSDVELQLRETNSLLDEMSSLKPNLTLINNTGKSLKENSTAEFVPNLDKRLKQINERYETIVFALREQSKRLDGLFKGRMRVNEAASELTTFLSSVVQNAPSENPIYDPIEMSQKIYKLTQLKDKVEKKRPALDAVIANAEENGESEKLTNLNKRWTEVATYLSVNHYNLKNASSDYGVFKTLSAQESDWLERLEKKLRNTAITAADAEEISEEHDDIENFLKNHPEDRLERMEQISDSLTKNNVLIPSVGQESLKLHLRWKELQEKAKNRLALLDGSIAEAQAWEYRLMEVQGWLTEKDILLTSHLDQELTVDDLPDESQEVMLREFEDKEYLLSEMDERVESYRDSGKIEAAARLEDQLMLIHKRYQELLMKFELFQQQPAVDYEPRLSRIHRQLRDIRQKLFLTELSSAEVNSINTQLHQANCIYNALSDIKPEVENVIKMGRKLVESEDIDQPEDLNTKIDNLKEDFNVIGRQITDAKETLETALEYGKQLEQGMESLQIFLANTDSEISNINNLTEGQCESFLVKKHTEATKMKETLKNVLRLKEELLGIGSPSSLGNLTQVLRGLESRWGKVISRLSKKTDTLKSQGKSRKDPLFKLNYDELLDIPEHNNIIDSSVNSCKDNLKQMLTWLAQARGKLNQFQSQCNKSELDAFDEERKKKEEKLLLLRLEFSKVAGGKEKNALDVQMNDVDSLWQEVNDCFVALLSKSDSSPEHKNKKSEFALDVFEEEEEDIIDTLPEESNSPLKRKLPVELDLSEFSKKSKEGRDLHKELALLSSRESSPDMELETSENAELAESDAQVNDTTKKAKEILVEEVGTNQGKDISDDKNIAKEHGVKEEDDVIENVGDSTKKTKENTIEKTPKTTLPNGTTSKIDIEESQSEILSFKISAEPPPPIQTPMIVQQEISEPKQATTPTKTPPKTLPKPRWFSLDRPEYNLPSLLTDSSNEAGDKLSEEELLAKENNAIERILRETDIELEEVRKNQNNHNKKKGISTQHLRDIKEFEDNVVSTLSKIESGHNKITSIEKQRNLAMKQELISLEVNMVQAEVKTLISRGDTLAMIIDRSDSTQAEELKNKVTSLKDSWESFKKSSDDKIEQSKKFENDIKQFRADVEDFKNWLRDVSSQVKRKRTNVNFTDLASTIRQRNLELIHLREKAALFKRKEMLGTQDIAVTMISTQFRDLQELVGKHLGPALTPITIEQSAPLIQNASKNENAAEIVARISKMRDAVIAIERQMDTQVLANKRYERLDEQKNALEVVSKALDKLRPTIKKTAKDLEVLTGCLSVEYLEKIVSLSEKLRDEWQQVNHRYSKRQTIWGQSRDKYDSFFLQLKNLDVWLESAEKILNDQESNASHHVLMASEEHVQVERQVSEKNKAVTTAALLGKEIMSDTSAQEYVEIQSSVDVLLKRWKSILSRLAAERDRLNREKYNNNVNFINKWIESNLQKIMKAVNISDPIEITEHIKVLLQYDTELLERNKQVDKLCNSNRVIPTDVIQNMRNNYQHVVEQIPKRRMELEQRLKILDTLVQHSSEALEWVREVALNLDGVKKHPNTQAYMDIKNMIDSKEPEINDIMTMYRDMEQRVNNDHLKMSEAVNRQVIDLRTQWDCLSSDCRQNLSQHQLNQKTTTFVEKTPPPSLEKTEEEEEEEEEVPRDNIVETEPTTAVDHLAPQTFASLRDHRDWIRRKKVQLASSTLAGDVKSLQKQVENHNEFSNELKEQRIPISKDIRLGKGLKNEEINECVKNLQKEWSELCDCSEIWQNKVDNALANMRMLEKDLDTLSQRLSEVEEAHKQISTMTSSGRRPLDHDGYENYQRLSAQVLDLEQILADLRDQSQRLPSLSSTTLIELDKVQTRLFSLKDQISEEQTRKLSNSVSTQIEAAPSSESNDERFDTALPAGWERSLNEDKVPYYLNHDEEKTQWDHPVFAELLVSLLTVNTVKYSVYRLALKLRKIQQKLCLDLLDMEAAVFGFEEHGLTAEKHNMAIRVPEMVLVLSSIYEALHGEEPNDVEVPLCVDLCLNWLLNMYDRDRQGQIRVLSFKIGVLMLCRGSLTEKYLYLFKLVSTEKKLSQRQLGLLLHDAMHIPKVLGEVASFGGSNIEPSVRSCFALGQKNKESAPPPHVDAPHFLKWLKQEPQCLVWLPVLHRLSFAEVARHNAKCSVCKMDPIIGFRYHCTKCFKFDLCHSCFFVCKTAKGHKQDHPMKEYCTNTGTSTNLKNLGQAVRNSFRSKKYFEKKQKKLGYLPVNSVQEGEDFASPSLSPNLSVESRDLMSGVSLQPKLILSNDGTSHTKSVDDEHLLIAQYCRVLNDGMDSDFEDSDSTKSPTSSVLRQFNVNNKGDLQNMIQELEEENRHLSKEYDSLRRQKYDEETTINGVNGEIEEELRKEAKQLKNHSQRMATRMKILESHNCQLADQINRLKILLTNGEVEETLVVRRGENFGTLQSKSVRASDLYSDEPTTSSNDETMERRRPPILGKKRGKDKFQSDDIDSLNLSDHDTQRICD